MANRVFEDRLGCWIVPDGNGQVAPKLGRLPGLKSLGVSDVFLPRQSQPSDFQTVRNAGMGAHLWAATDEFGEGVTTTNVAAKARDYANRFLLDFQRYGSKGAGELNIELSSDPPLKAYMRRAVELIRQVKPKLPLRINIAPRKAFALPIDLLQSDPNLYVCEQNFEGAMAELLSPLDVWLDMTGGLGVGYGVPPAKATVCYAAACSVRGSARIRTLPADLTRGVIFQDDLLADAGLI